MKTLQVNRLKPNPWGKDRNMNGTAIVAQLGAEWVDIKNTGTSPLNLNGVKLHHVTFVNGKPSHWSCFVQFGSNILGVGEVARVHAGSGPLAQLSTEDILGAHLHFFTQRDQYVWNNVEGDTCRITESINYADTEIDCASYGPNPREGAILTRAGSMLI